MKKCTKKYSAERKRKMAKEFVKRYQGNPILTKDDIPYKVETVHNAGVAKYNGKYMMLMICTLQKTTQRMI